MVRDTPWNSNIHYHQLLLSAIPNGAKGVIDVGCGDGILCAQLVQRGVEFVVGVDTDADVLQRARARFPGLPIERVDGDVLNSDSLPHRHYDAVLSVATLHHMDAAPGLTRLADLARPGGVVGVNGLDANDWWGLPCAAAGQFMRRLASVTRVY